MRYITYFHPFLNKYLIKSINQSISKGAYDCTVCHQQLVGEEREGRRTEQPTGPGQSPRYIQYT